MKGAFLAYIVLVLYEKGKSCHDYFNDNNDKKGFLVKIIVQPN